MKKWTRAAAGFASVLLTAVGVMCVAVRLPEGTGQKAAAAAAGFIIPAGNTDGFFRVEEEEGSISSRLPSGSTSGQPAVSGQSSASESAQSSQGLSSALSSVPSPQVSGSHKFLELSVQNSGTQVGDIWVKNSTEHHGAIDLAQELQKIPAVKIQKSTSPQVLIYHTHTTESYDFSERTTDKTQSVCAVGDAIAQELQSAGIGVLHDTTYHDYPAYDGSYDRSRATMMSDLKKYPGIQVTLDIHRDAMHRNDGTYLKTTTVVNGKKAAQLMIVAGCDDDGTLGFPNWEYNLRLALRLQKCVSDNYPGLARPLDFGATIYNENVTKGSLLIEIGTDANTLDESKYTGQLLGKSLAQVLGGLT
ncbi:MAG TPA: stage II sporulation protein P [Caproicibacter sp.]|nr:stage II sporulation protein P [Caproicibacter sp.]